MDNLPHIITFYLSFRVVEEEKHFSPFFLFRPLCYWRCTTHSPGYFKSINEVPKQVYFTRKSDNDSLKQEFYTLRNSNSEDIHIWCDYLLFRLFTVHYFAFYINRHDHVHVFSSNSTFFYDMLPFLKNHVVKTELLHNFTFGKKGMEFLVWLVLII